MYIVSDFFIFLNNILIVAWVILLHGIHLVLQAFFHAFKLLIDFRKDIGIRQITCAKYSTGRIHHAGQRHYGKIHKESSQNNKT